MKKKFNCILACMLSGIIALTQIPPFCVTSEASQTQEKTSFEKYGNLKIVTSKKNVQGKEITNRQICDKDGNPVQLKGMSTFGLQWEDGAWVLMIKHLMPLLKTGNVILYVLQCMFLKKDIRQIQKKCLKSRIWN